MWITLTGFMASGKSSVAERLGRALGRPVAVLDERIAHHAGRTIPEIFEQRGEAAFREMELEELRNLEAGTDWIVDTGGGIVQTAEAVDLLRARGPVIWLDVDWETLQGRLEGETSEQRPLVGRLGRGGLEVLYRRRLPRYAQASDFRLRAGELDSEELARLAERRFRSWSGLRGGGGAAT